MVEATIIQSALCPWCHNAMDIMRSGKTGYHYANCKSCNAHFRNIPVAMIESVNSRDEDFSSSTSRSSGSKEGSLYERIFGEKNSKEEYKGIPLPKGLRRYLKQDD